MEYKANIYLKILILTLIFFSVSVYSKNNPKCIIQYNYDILRSDNEKFVGRYSFQRVFYDSVIIKTWHLRQHLVDSEIVDGFSDTLRIDSFYYNEYQVYKINRNNDIKQVFFDKEQFNKNIPIIISTGGLPTKDGLFHYKVYFPIKKVINNDEEVYKIAVINFSYTKLGNNVFDKEGIPNMDYIIDSLTNVDYSKYVKDYYTYNEDDLFFKCCYFYYNFKYGKILKNLDTYNAEVYKINVIYESEGCKDLNF